MITINQLNDLAFQRKLLLLEVFAVFLLWGGAALGESSDPDVVARAEKCGSHMYFLKDNSVQPDEYADGPGPKARFLRPQGIAIDAQGMLYIADNGNFAIRRITPAGIVTTLAGTPGRQGCSDGKGSQASFYRVNSIAVDKEGALFALDASTNKIRRVSSSGQVNTLKIREAPPTFDGKSVPMSIENSTPMGIAIDSSYIYVTLPNAVLRITQDGSQEVLAGSPKSYGAYAPERQDQEGRRDGKGGAARFGSAHGIAVDSKGTVYVTDGVIKSILPHGDVNTFAGVEYDFSISQNSSIDGDAHTSRFFVPEGVAVDRNGNLYVADRRNSTIRKVSPDGWVTTLAGTPGKAGSQDGTGTEARFVSPTAITVDGDGNLYVADSMDNTIRKVTASGVVTTIAGLSSFRQGIREAAQDQSKMRAKPNAEGNR